MKPAAHRAVGRRTGPKTADKPTIISKVAEWWAAKRARVERCLDARSNKEVAAENKEVDISTDRNLDTNRRLGTDRYLGTVPFGN